MKLCPYMLEIETMAPKSGSIVIQFLFIAMHYRFWCTMAYRCIQI